MHAQQAAINKEMVDKGVTCVSGLIDTETGEMVFTTPNLEHIFDKNPELRDALEAKLRRTLFNDADPTTSL